MFEAILPVVIAYALLRLRDDERVAVAQVLAWDCWRRRPGLAASAYARMAVRRVLSGRDLPGCAMSRRDIYRRLTKVEGAEIGEVGSRAPGPDAVAEAKEELDRLHTNASPKVRRFLELAQEGETTTAIAAALGLSLARVSQLRREAMDLLK